MAWALNLPLPHSYTAAIMKITIVGAGAIGGWIGARLATAPTAPGHSPLELSALARGATLAALRSHGWRLRSPDGSVQCPVQSPGQATDRPAELGPQDVVLIAVKGPALEALAPQLQPLIGPQTLIVPAMNGVPWWFCAADDQPAALRDAPLRSLDPQGLIAAALPRSQVAACVVHGSATCPEPGVVEHRMGRGLLLGPAWTAPAHPQLPETLNRLVHRLQTAGFEASRSSDIRRDIWYKLWGNLTMNPVSALTRSTMDQVLADPLLRGFCSMAMQEAAAIGARIGCPIDQSPEDRHAVTARLGAVKTSMLQDLEAGRPLEIDAIVGAVQEMGARLGVETPAINGLFGLVRVLELNRRPTGPL